MIVENWKLMEGWLRISYERQFTPLINVFQFVCHWGEIYQSRWLQMWELSTLFGELIWIASHHHKGYHKWILGQYLEQSPENELYSCNTLKRLVCHNREKKQGMIHKNIWSFTYWSSLLSSLITDWPGCRRPRDL